MKCLQCEVETNNPKFCSTSCAAKYNNRIRPKRRRRRYFCKSCGVETGYRRNYCASCNPTRPRDFGNVTLAEIKSRTRYQANAWIRNLARRAYYASNKPQHCIQCGYSRHIEICHLKPIQNFPESATISVVNSLDNLVALCPNCHWELDHGILSL